MKTTLQAPHPCATDAKRFFLASAAWDSIHLNYSGVTDQTMEAAHSEAVRLSRAADARRRGALRSGEKRRRH
jgi:hypothetical protein